MSINKETLWGVLYIEYTGWEYWVQSYFNIDQNLSASYVKDRYVSTPANMFTICIYIIVKFTLHVIYTPHL
jgi:hypothetical protein